MKRGIVIFILLAAAALALPAAAQLGEPPRLNVEIPGVDLTKTVREGRHITVPFLAQYVAGVYRFLIAIVGVLAAAMMMVGGFQYLTAGGGADRAKLGREKIANAIIGLLLALGSYVILYTINPDLVTFEGLKIEATERETIPDAAGEEEADFAADGPAKPICNTHEACKALCAQPPDKRPKSAPGIPDTSQLQVIKTGTGVKNSRGIRASPAVVEAMIRVSGIASRDGHIVYVSSGHRPLQKQIQLACDKYDQGLENHIPRYVSWPGGSNHGSGNAVDVWLEKDGKNLTVIDSKTQGNSEYADGADKLAQIMTEAGFKRYSKEIWHFEIGTASSCRCQHPRCPFPPKWCTIEEQIKEEALMAPMLP